MVCPEISVFVASITEETVRLILKHTQFGCEKKHDNTCGRNVNVGRVCGLLTRCPGDGGLMTNQQKLENKYY